MGGFDPDGVWSHRVAKEVAFVSRCLAILKERQPFDEAGDGGFDAVRGILERSIASERLGWEQRFLQTGDVEFGPHGEIQDTPVYSNRGAELIELQNLLRVFLEKRNEVLDHAAAHRSLMKIMSG
ncbi:hypothetical protein [Oceaniglobus indicus]|uniref:hypothetical protein n=1 Tax=Oceaniglobus indicus TaxID=2047749 RepID=UPI0014734540|nr:hypothetical protein [Oceaniglobus indicus]